MGLPPVEVSTREVGLNPKPGRPGTTSVGRTGEPERLRSRGRVGSEVPVPDSFLCRLMTDTTSVSPSYPHLRLGGVSRVPDPRHSQEDWSDVPCPVLLRVGCHWNTGRDMIPYGQSSPFLWRRTVDGTRPKRIYHISYQPVRTGWVRSPRPFTYSPGLHRLSLAQKSCHLVWSGRFLRRYRVEGDLPPALRL